MRTFHILIATFLIIETLANKLSIFLGGQINSNLTQVKANVDISMNQTIISSIDFACIPENGCTTDNVSFNISKNGKDVQFYKAYVAVNLINKANTGSLEIVYLYNDTANIGSILGLCPTSNFIKYYYKQNQLNGFNVEFDIDWDNKIEFTTFNHSSHILLPVQPYNVTFTDIDSDVWKAFTARMCFMNSFYGDSQQNTIIGVANKTYQSMSNFINSEKSKKDDDFAFLWINQDHRFVTQMNYNVSEFLGPNKSLLIHSVPDSIADKNGCDIYTGSLMLKKYDFHVVYSETPQNFVYQYALNSSATLINPFDPKKKEDNGVSVWIIFVLIIFILAIIYFVYYWYIKREEQNQANQGDYVAMGIPPVEMNDHR